MLRRVSSRGVRIDRRRHFIRPAMPSHDAHTCLMFFGRPRPKDQVPFLRDPAGMSGRRTEIPRMPCVPRRRGKVFSPPIPFGLSASDPVLRCVRRSFRCYTIIHAHGVSCQRRGHRSVVFLPCPQSSATTSPAGPSIFLRDCVGKKPATSRYVQRRARRKVRVLSAAVDRYTGRTGSASHQKAKTFLVVMNGNDIRQSLVERCRVAAESSWRAAIGASQCHVLAAHKGRSDGSPA